MRTEPHLSAASQAAQQRYITRKEYTLLLDKLEDIQDELTILRAQSRKGASADAWTDDLAGRMLAGESLLRLWREHRKLSLDQLSRTTGIAKGYLSEIESGKKPGSVASLKKCAKALQIDLDDLVRG